MDMVVDEDHLDTTRMVEDAEVDTAAGAMVVVVDTVAAEVEEVVAVVVTATNVGSRDTLQPTVGVVAEIVTAEVVVADTGGWIFYCTF